MKTAQSFVAFATGLIENESITKFLQKLIRIITILLLQDLAGTSPFGVDAGVCTPFWG